MDTPASIDVNDCFGSPPEPIFNESKNSLSRELLQDSLKLLASKNEAAVTRNEQDETEGCLHTKNKGHHTRNNLSHLHSKCH